MGSSSANAVSPLWANSVSLSTPSHPDARRPPDGTPHPSPPPPLCSAHTDAAPAPPPPPFALRTPTQHPRLPPPPSTPWLCAHRRSTRGPSACPSMPMRGGVQSKG